VKEGRRSCFFCHCQINSGKKVAYYGCIGVPQQRFQTLGPPKRGADGFVDQGPDAPTGHDIAWLGGGKRA
jgi:hypothetical protein